MGNGVSRDTGTLKSEAHSDSFLFLPLRVRVATAGVGSVGDWFTSDFFRALTGITGVLRSIISHLDGVEDPDPAFIGVVLLDKLGVADLDLDEGVADSGLTSSAGARLFSVIEMESLGVLE